MNDPFLLSPLTTIDKEFVENDNNKHWGNKLWKKIQKIRKNGSFSLLL